MRVTVRYWAGARRAAGCATEALEVRDLADLRAQLGARPALTTVVAAASLLIDGRQPGTSVPLTDDALIDVLPPFAGG